MHGLQQTDTIDDAPLATFESTRDLVRRTCRELVALTQFCKRRRRCRPHVARPRPIAEMHTSRFFCEFERKVAQQVPRKSDEIYGMRLVKTLRILQSLWSVKPCTTNRAIIFERHNPAHFHQTKRRDPFDARPRRLQNT